ncbi:hypothetical protein VNI00_014971 [Paramarasmius palmivorus]|uniref:ferric-chelate reductase (NADPH) n=1 Tax=Paramarasmius palmivorus TaxID=297713 RepID=A0AAW0BNZ5_9AGAR
MKFNMSAAGNSTMAGTAMNGTTAGAGSTSGAATAAGSRGGGGGGGEVDSEMLMFNIDIVILSLLAVLVFLRLPRAIARLWKTSEWTRGHLLWYSRFPGNPSQRVVWGNDTGLPYTGGDYTTDSSHTLHGTELQRVSKKGTPIDVSYPPHIVSTPASFRPMLTLLHKRITPGVSLSHLVIMSIYLGVLIFPAFWETNAFTDPVRFGWLAVGQYPFVFGFATKNNILGALMGAGYEKLNFMHRFVGRLVVLSANVHGLGYCYKYLLNKTFQESIARPSNYWGLIALICMDCLFFFSTDFWRKRAYNIFIATHISSICLLLAATMMHKRSTVLWVYATIGIYGLDVLLRIVKTRFATATVRILPGLGVTRVEVPDINAGWRAGQHVRVRVFSSGMGLFGWSEIHPFTIASTAHGPEGLVLMCKKTGSWTRKLYGIAQRPESAYEDGSRKVKVMIEGPYGGPGHRMFASFSAAVFVVGGSGITFALSSIQELIQQDLDGKSRVKYIHLIWTVQDPCRPKLHEFFESVIDNVTDMRTGYKDERAISGVIIGVCGPVGLADTVFQDVGKVDRRKRDDIGGIEVHEETFGW